MTSLPTRPAWPGRKAVRAVTKNVKGNLFLKANNESGRTSGYQYYFDFNEGKLKNPASGFPYPLVHARVVCAWLSKPFRWSTLGSSFGTRKDA